MNHESQGIQSQRGLSKEPEEKEIERRKFTPRKRMPEEEKRRRQDQNFWRKVTKSDGCWKWIGCLHADGYGQMQWHGRNMRAHRISWILHHGEIPTGMQILHKCDNPQCTNPDHLFLGTQYDNIMDMVKKRRHSHGAPHYNCSQKGERQWCAKLTADDVREIRLRCSRGESQVKVGKEYGFHQSHISKIMRRLKWKHVT